MSPLGDDLNLKPRRIEEVPRLDARSAEATLDQVRDMLDLAKNNLIRTQRRIERNEKYAESLSRQVMALWVLVIMVIVGFGLLTWYLVLLQKNS